MSLYGEYYLEHHGVKGMKWGVRRYQNPDGSLTPAGKKRQARNEQVRAKQIERYSRMEKAERDEFERQKKNVQELYRQGPDGEYMKKMYGDMSEFEELGYTKKGLFEDELREWNLDANISAIRAEAFVAGQKALMAMDVSTCKKSKIYEIGRQAVNNAFSRDADEEDTRYY